MQPQTTKAANATQRRSTRALSEKVAAAYEARATSAPMLVSGIGPGKLQTIALKTFSRLDVDPRYQRGRTSMVNALVRALQAGGQVLDPVTLCKRPWESGDKLWIIDGYQRVCAFQQLGMAFDAMVHESASIESEKAFFLSLNNRNAVSSDVIVKSWNGPSAQMLFAANESMDHVLYQRVHFGQGAARSLLSASLLIRGTAAAATGKLHGGQIQKQLSRLDHHLKEEARIALAEHYLRLIGMIYTNTTVSAFVAARLGIVAYQRWGKEQRDMPSKSVIERLREINWHNEFPSLTIKFSTNVIEKIQKVWKS